MLLLLEEVPILFLIASLTHFLSKIWKKPFEADHWPVVFVFGFMASEPLTSLVQYRDWYISSFADLWGIRIFNLVSHSIVLYGALVFVKHITSQATGTALQAARS
jgi:hypothetical protein